ncbi:MAG TPA: hypothetical protein VF993_15275, partial [Myxococcales bacterium]
MRNLFALLLLSAGCIAGHAVAERDDRLLREVSRQQRWAQQAVEARPSPEQLERIRSSDYEAVGSARKELRRLIQAIDRGTWVREALLEAMRDDDDPQLLREFDHAGSLRKEAIAAADELADALADAKGGLTMADLRPGLDALRKAQASEDRIAKMPGRAPGALKLAASPLPQPRPFLDAAAKIVHAHAEMARELDKLAPDDAAKIRAKMAELALQKEESKPAAAPASPPPESEAQGPSDTLSISNDAAALIAKKGPPRSITWRADGLFNLHWDDKDTLVYPDGKLAP